MEQTITIIRRKENYYTEEEINTEVLLPGSRLSDEENRQNTIARLRKDPSVIFILNLDEGPYEETASLCDGFEMTLSLDWDAEPAALIRVTHHNELVCHKEYELKEEDDLEDFYDSFLGDCAWILGCIERKAYYFVDETHPLYPRTVEVKPVEIYDIERLLEDKGYQTERISVVGEGNTDPLLLIHENEVAMIGSCHFSGKHLFVELKRDFDAPSAGLVEAAVAKVKHDYHPSVVDIIHWPDGSWSFRMYLDSDVPLGSYLEHILSHMAEIRTVIDRIQIELQHFPSEQRGMHIVRQYFIYEAIDASLKLSRIAI